MRPIASLARSIAALTNTPPVTEQAKLRLPTTKYIHSVTHTTNTMYLLQELVCDNSLFRKCRPR